MSNNTESEVRDTTKKKAKAAVRVGAIVLLAAVAVVFLFRSGVRATTALCPSGTPCVSTYGYDNARNNVNPNETVLKASNLFNTAPTIQTSGDLNGTVYGQPLYVPGLDVGGNTKSGLFVATEENWVYGLDATAIGTNLWTPLNLNNSGETAVPDDILDGGAGCSNIPAEVGVTGTPVIDVDPSSKQPQLMYVVSTHYAPATGIVQRLNAISITDGTLKYHFNISANLSYFSAENENQRAGLALMHDSNHDPVVFVSWGSHCDAPTDGFNGRVAAFELATSGGTTSFSLVGDFSTTPTDSDNDYPDEGGVWMSGAAPAIDDGDGSADGDVYLAVGNGGWNGTHKFGQSALRLRLDVTAMTLNEKGFYTPGQWSILNDGSDPNCSTNGIGALYLPHPLGGTLCLPSGDYDFGSGGVTLAYPVGSSYTGPSPVMLSGGKTGIIYALDPAQMLLNTTADSATSACTTGTGGQAVDCLTGIELPNPLGSQPDNGDRCSMAFWDGPSGTGQTPVNAFYVAGATDVSSNGTGQVRAWQMKNDGTFTVLPEYGTVNYPTVSTGTATPYPGACPVISWNSAGGTHAADAILWILDTSNFQTSTQTQAARVGLYAYTALPNSSTHVIGLANSWAGDTTHGPGASKFMVPTVVNGYIYVAGQKPNVTCSDVFDDSTHACKGQIVSWH
jgi:hypothetical protein